MAYVKNIWVDQDVERPKTYEVTNNQDGSITLTDSFGLVTELGTPVNEVNMNHIEDGIDGCAIRKHNLTETFALGEWVLGGTGDDEGIYKSLVANNVGNAISNDTKWEKVEMGGNSRNIGEIVASTIPLVDAGSHLLDGALISGSGSYSAFVDYIADLYDSGDYDDIFETEANWQNAVSTYGVCGKFVYDSVNNTVRLPKITGIVEGTTDLTALGDLVEAGLPNITGTLCGENPTSSDYWANITGAFYKTSPTGKTGTSTSDTDNVNVGLDASLSSSIYGNSSTVQPQTVKVLYYIVIATSTKTDIEVDIDDIATDLNGKMDKDGTNAVNSVKFADGQWVESSNIIASSTSISYHETKTYDLSSYLPNDNYSYEVLFGFTGQSGSSSGNTICAYIGSDMVSELGYIPIAYSVTRTSGSAYGGGNAIIPIGAGRIVKIWSSSSANFTFSLYARIYRRIGTNQ